MRHQLKPNTYTICESTEQCKELFEWAKANGVSTYGEYRAGADVLLFSGNRDLSAKESPFDSCDFEKETPLPEFISRLKGEWVEGKTVTLPIETWLEIQGILAIDNDSQSPAYKHDYNSLIEEQLNNQ